MTEEATALRGTAVAAGVDDAVRPQAVPDAVGLRSAGYILLASMAAMTLAARSSAAIAACSAAIAAYFYWRLRRERAAPFARVSAQEVGRAISTQMLSLVFMFVLFAAFRTYLAVMLGADDGAAAAAAPFGRLLPTPPGASVGGLQVLNACLLIPLSEELLFRGYLLRRFRSLGTGVAIGLTAALFAALHPAGTQQIFALACGLLWGANAVANESLVPCTAAHILSNGAMLLIVQSGVANTLSNRIAEGPSARVALALLLVAAAACFFLQRSRFRELRGRSAAEAGILLPPGETLRIVLHWPILLILAVGTSLFSLTLFHMLTMPLAMRLYAL